jgi:hypothetical protein
MKNRPFVITISYFSQYCGARPYLEAETKPWHCIDVLYIMDVLAALSLTADFTHADFTQRFQSNRHMGVGLFGTGRKLLRAKPNWYEPGPPISMKINLGTAGESEPSGASFQPRGPRQDILCGLQQLLSE